MSFSVSLKPLSIIIFNYIAILFCLKIGVVLHELGHLLFAKLAGGNPKRIILGQGHEIYRFEVSNIKIILNQNFKGGLAFSNFNSMKQIRLRRLVNVLGGPLTNLILVIIVYNICGFDFRFILGLNGINFFSALIFANVLLVVISLLPYYVTQLGVKLPSDGLSMLKLIFSKEKNISFNRNDLFEAYEFIEAKQYNKGLPIYEKYIDDKDMEIVAKMNIGLIYSKINRVEEAYSIMRLYCQ